MSDAAPKICMIDDDEHDAFLARRIFLRQRPHVRFEHRSDAGDIYDDVDSLRTSDLGYPDFIFLDINMPRASGLSILHKLKIHPTMRRIPVFIFTTSDMPEHVEIAYASGASADFVKPHSVDEFVRLARVFAEFWIDTLKRPTLIPL